MRIFIKIIAFTILLFSALILYDRYDMRAPIAFEALQQIDPIPKTKALINENKLFEAEDYLSFFIQYEYVKNNPQAWALLKDIQTQRQTLGYKANNILSGVMTGKSNELEGQISAGVSDFFLFGDIRDLTIEGYHHITNKEVDKVLVALSSIGVVASGLTLVTAGASTPIKGSLSFLKYAKRNGKLPRWMGKYIMKSAKEIKQSKSLGRFENFFTELYTLIRTSGINGSMKLLSHTKNIKTFQEAVNFSKLYGKNSATLLTILGKDTVKYAKGTDKKAFLYASTYGKTGVKRLHTLGEKGFLKSLQKPVKISRISKVFNKNIVTILKQIPDAVFYTLGLLTIMILT